MWKFSISVLVLGVLYFEVTGRHIEHVANGRGATKHNKLRRDTSGGTFRTCVDKLQNIVTDITASSEAATKNALQRSNPARLNDDQRMAVYLYTNRTSTFYRQLNNKLREGNGAGEFQVCVDLLLEALEEIGKSGPLTLWRVVDGRLLEHKVGETVVWLAFSSTSLKLNAVLPEQNTSTMYKIEMAYGYKINAYSPFDFEEEVLLPPDASVVVKATNASDPDQLRYVVEMKSRGTRTSLCRYVWFIVVLFVSQVGTP